MARKKETQLIVSHIVRLNGKSKGSIEYIPICWSCQENSVETPEGKYCDSCKRNFKESEIR